MSIKVPGIYNYIPQNFQHIQEGYQQEHSFDEDVTFLIVGIESLQELTGQDLTAPNDVPSMMFQSCRKFQTLLPGDSYGPSVPDQGNAL